MEEQSKESRVWQRVLAGAGDSREDLRPLIHLASENAMAWLHLLRRATGRNREALQRLYDRARINTNCLRGLQRLRFGTAGRQNPLPPPGEPMEKLLEGCYRRTRQLMGEYAARSAEPEYGAVFAVMGQREQDSAALIAELLGMTEP